MAGYRIVLRCIDETRVGTASSASLVSAVQRGPAQVTLPPVSMPTNSSSRAQAQAAIERADTLTAEWCLELSTFANIHSVFWAVCAT